MISYIANMCPLHKLTCRCENKIVGENSNVFLGDLVQHSTDEEIQQRQNRARETEKIGMEVCVVLNRRCRYVWRAAFFGKHSNTLIFDISTLYFALESTICSVRLHIFKSDAS